MEELGNLFIIFRLFGRLFDMGGSLTGQDSELLSL
jgi:hypothetical protein